MVYNYPFCLLRCAIRLFLETRKWERVKTVNFYWRSFVYCVQTIQGPASGHQGCMPGKKMHLSFLLTAFHVVYFFACLCESNNPRITKASFKWKHHVQRSSPISRWETFLKSTFFLSVVLGENDSRILHRWIGVHDSGFSYTVNSLGDARQVLSLCVSQLNLFLKKQCWENIICVLILWKTCPLYVTPISLRGLFWQRVPFFQ